MIQGKEAGATPTVGFYLLADFNWTENGGKRSKKGARGAQAHMRKEEEEEEGMMSTSAAWANHFALLLGGCVPKVHKCKEEEETPKAKKL